MTGIVCGIVGFVHLFESAQLPDAGKIIADMLEEVAARGPDARGTWHDASAHLGHCRLSIIDLSEASAQPMTLKDGQLVIVYNGEIYNYQELRRSLVELGERFFSSGDTEVLLRGLNRFGLGWLKELNGMFAAAVWDKQKRKLTLFRDRFGIKPLYWTVIGGTVLFSSQIKSFLRFPRFKAKFDPHWLNEYLTFQNSHGSSTPFAGVCLLEPGQALVFEKGRTMPERVIWASRRSYNPDYRLSVQSARQETATLFSEAVRNTLISDVPVGSYLSGGIDSGAVVTLASHAEPQLHTFTCGLSERTLSERNRSMNEVKYARELADRLGSKFHQTLLSPSDIAEMHPRILKTIEDPRLGVSYQNDAAAKLASSFVRVCLSGAGGDELFGGYPWRYRTIRHVETRQDFLRSYYGFWQRVYTDAGKQELFESKILREIDLDLPFERFASHFPQEADYSDLGVKTWLCLRYESDVFLHGLLQVGDRLAGAYGLEERFPFLDNNLVDFVDTIPAEYHWDPDEQPVDGKFLSGKRLLRDALSRLVPPEITTRRKQGFTIPVREWFDGPLAAFVGSILGNKAARINEFFVPGTVAKAMAANREGRFISAAQLWSLLSVEAILTTFFS